MSTRGDAGFTLVEMLVSLVLFGLVSIAGLSVLETLLRVDRQSEGRLAALDRLDRGLSVLAQDLERADKRTLRLDTTLEFEADGEVLNYRLARDVLWRVIARENREIEQPLIVGVDDVAWRVLDAENTWQKDWQASASRAVSLTLSLDDGSELHRLFALIGP
ncbi:MAG: type II secretion system protein GspJ [Pseudomonadota bacterium]